MKKFKPFTFLLFIFTILFLFFAPGFIRSGLDKTKSDVQKNEYKGILTLWHINGWQTGKATTSAYLKKCIQSFENKNAYVFIELKTLTPVKASEKILSGEKPDIISFPTGFFEDPALLMPLDKAGFDNPFLSQSCMYGGKTYAFAFLLNAYLLYYNQELLFEKEIDEAAFEKPTFGELTEAAKILSFTRTEGKKQKEIYGMAAQSEFITSPYAALAYFQENGKEPSALEASGAISVQAENGLELFLNKQAAFLISSAATLNTLRNSKQTPPAFGACAFSLYSDMAQYMGICKTDDQNKLNCCKNFLYSLLNEKNIRRAEETGAFPVLFMEDLYPDDPVLKNAYRILVENGVFPNAFAFSRIKDDLKRHAKGAMTGDMQSIENIRSLLSKKLYS